MHIKRFEAPSMAEALGKVRAEFGSEALVLSTRSVRRDGGFFGRLGKPVVEITAAIDRDARLRSGPAREERVGPDESWRALGLSRALVEPLEAEIRSLRRTVDRLGSAAPAEFEISELRRIACELAQRASVGGLGAEACRGSGRYLTAGLAPRHAFSLAAEAAADGDACSDEALVLTLATRIEARLKPAREDDRPLVMVVGPAGSGKTTTLAKVAARERDFCLVTTDVNRVGADDVLRAYARSLDVPFETAVSPASLQESLARAGRRPCFVDTAGRSRSDPAALSELSELRHVLGSRARVQLVVSATTKEADLRAQVARYRALAPEALVVTKTDESQELCNVLNLLLDEEVPPLAWFANGQRVPQDLVVPDPVELAQQALGVAA